MSAVERMLRRGTRLAIHGAKVGRRVWQRAAVPRHVAREAHREWRRQRTAWDDAVTRRGAGNIMDVDGRRLPGVTAAFLTPAEHRAHVATRVLEAFSDYPSFLIPHGSRMPHTIAVVADTTEFRRVLAHLSSAHGWYVAPPDPRMPGGVGGIRHGADDDVVAVFAVVGGEDFAYGPSLAVEVQRWSVDDDGSWVAPKRNGITELVAPAEQRFDELTTVGGPFPTLATMAVPSITDVTFPIDVVYTWVDGNDPAWQAERNAALGVSDQAVLTESATADSRFREHDELRYSLRSIERYAPWVNHVWLVTSGQVPSWLDTTHPGITVVSHRDIWSPAGRLPTFNSHAIEAHLHRIPGLSEHYLYLNDDVFFGRECPPEVFFEANGIQRMFFSSALVPDGDPQPGEIASESAGKNARRLIEELTGRRLRRKLFHAPFALRRSVSEEIVERYREVVEATTQSVFRRMSDVTVSGALHLYYALATGRAVRSRIRYRYVNMQAPDIDERLRRMLTQDRYEVFCLNDTGVVEEDAEAIGRRTRDFLDAYFPNKSSYER